MKGVYIYALCSVLVVVYYFECVFPRVQFHTRGSKDHRSSLVYTAETEPELGCWAMENLLHGMVSCIGLEHVPQGWPVLSDR